MNRPLLVVLAFLGVFLAGAVSGGVVGMRIKDRIARRQAAELFAQQQFKRLSDQLGLSDEQRKRIRPIITRAGKEVQERRREILEIVEIMESDLRKELTETQRQQYDRARNRMRDNERVFQRWLREQRARRFDQQQLNEPAAPAPNSNAPIPAAPSPKT